MTALLETRDLTKTFGGLVAVADLDLAVGAGEIHALIGPNGAGKTTVLNLLTRVYQPTAGTVRFDGADLLAAAPHDVARRGIARTFQHVEAFAALPVLTNVMIGAHTRGATGLLDAVVSSKRLRRETRAAEEEARRWLAFVGLDGLADRPASALTGGQGRLLGLARALASAPRLLLLDELVAGLNSRETGEVAQLVRRLRDEHGITVLLIEHDMRFVMSISDRVTVLNFGRRIAVGTPAEVRRDPVVVEAYLGSGRFGHAGD